LSLPSLSPDLLRRVALQGYCELKHACYRCFDLATNLYSTPGPRQQFPTRHENSMSSLWKARNHSNLGGTWHGRFTLTPVPSVVLTMICHYSTMNRRHTRIHH
jgi:hypothetical protein